MTSDEKIKTLRLDILDAAMSAKEGHIASAFSVLDILYVLYNNVMRHDPKWPAAPCRDYFFLSKGHASLALYAVLADQGYFPKTLLKSACKAESVLGGHPHRDTIQGVEASTGSLGHGLPMAVGMAMALRYEKVANRVFCVVGDGELNEGSNWEALLLASHHCLTNLHVVVDYNHSNDRALSLDPVCAKFTAFGWQTLSGVDGHAHEALIASLACGLEHPQKGPHVLIANTTKGKGLRAMEEEPHAWHHRVPSAEEYQNFRHELLS